jgi:DNA (cytosine-5)-methyltransferase 1
MIKYLSLFSGIGGFELGIQQAYENNEHAHIGEESEQEERTQRGVGSSDLGGVLLHNRDRTAPLCIGYSEIDKYAIATYQKHYPTHHNYGDITKINADELPDFDLLVGGFPCQAFSIAGKRKGFEDTRGTLFFEIARILKAKQPRLFLLENVKGLLSHDNGQTFRTIIATLDELGYDLEWQVLNSKNHGVPQNRERIFIVGHLRGTSRPEVFPITGNDGQVNGLPRHISNTLTARYEGAQATGTYIGEGKLDAQETEPSGQGILEGRNQSDSSDGSGGQTHSTNIRRLTPTECERLQGFPDGWTIGSDTQRYKQCGNAVTVNVIRDIMERLSPCLQTPIMIN